MKNWLFKKIRNIDIHRFIRRKKKVKQIINISTRKADISQILRTLKGQVSISNNTPISLTA